MERITVLGIDLAKSVFEFCGVEKEGNVIYRKRIRRAQVLQIVTQLGPERVAMEACGSSNYWGREFQKLGCKVQLISPQYVRPFVKTNKSDRADAEAITAAASHPGMRFVEIKTVAQQDVLSVHRIRQRLIKHRTALVNELRGLLGEYGEVMAKGKVALQRQSRQILSNEQSSLTPRMRHLVEDLLLEWGDLEKRIETYEAEIDRLHQGSEVCQRLTTVPGIGPITATALEATLGNAHQFKKGRQLSAYLGLVPRHVGTGGKNRVLSISKRGNEYLRRLLVHGARSALLRIHSHKTRTSLWIKRIEEQRGFNKAVVALANKNARIAWVILTRGEKYRTPTIH